MSDAPVSVTLNPTPPTPPVAPQTVAPATATLKAPPGTTEVFDSLGRRLVIKRLDALAQFDLFEACGASSGNDRLLGMAMLTASVLMIGDEMLAFPMTRDALRRRVREVGDAGIDAAASVLRPQGMADTDADVATAKN